jgi:hypothetical protein
VEDSWGASEFVALAGVIGTVVVGVVAIVAGALGRRGDRFHSEAEARAARDYADKRTSYERLLVGVVRVQERMSDLIENIEKALAPDWDGEWDDGETPDSDWATMQAGAMLFASDPVRVCFAAVHSHGLSVAAIANDWIDEKRAGGSPSTDAMRKAYEENETVVDELAKAMSEDLRSL